MNTTGLHACFPLTQVEYIPSFIPFPYAPVISQMQRILFQNRFSNISAGRTVHLDGARASSSIIGVLILDLRSPSSASARAIGTLC